MKPLGPSNVSSPSPKAIEPDEQPSSADGIDPGTPKYSGQEGQIDLPDGRAIRLVDAPSIEVDGTRYRVDRRHPTSSMLAIRRARQGEAETVKEAKNGFDQLVEAVRDVRDPMAMWKGAELFEGIRDYLDQRTDRPNRSSQWAEVLASLPVDARVVRLERGLRALAKSLSADKLPGVTPQDLIELSGRTQATAFNFDIDHNILHLPGANYVINHKTGDVKAFDHGEWAKMRGTVGEPGPLADYKVLSSDLVYGTFQEASDGTDASAFVRALENAVKGSSTDWQAPMWSEFVWALARPETAQNVFITTARGHFPRTIRQGLQSVLQASGMIEHVPDEDHIFPVTAHGIAQSEDYSQEKVRFIRMSLDKVQGRPFGPAAELVKTTEGDAQAILHTMVFSDDDLRTAKLVRDALQADQAAGRWPDVKVIVRFTGVGHKTSSPWSVVVGGTKGPRTATEAELGEPVAVRERGDKARNRMAKILGHHSD